MVKKCVYCKKEIDNESVIDVCERCGEGVWGKKMFQAIIENMNKAMQKGDLYQGLVNEELQRNVEETKEMNSFKIKI